MQLIVINCCPSLLVWCWLCLVSAGQAGGWAKLHCPTTEQHGVPRQAGWLSG